MRILFITNYYPPCHYDWGYMQLCEETADGMAARGHDVAVLTSVYRHGQEPERPYPVYRLLPIDPDWNLGVSAYRQFFDGRRDKEQQAVAHLRRIAAQFRPDVIFAWHCIGLPRVMLQTAENMSGVAMAYYLANYLPELPDEYIQYWESPAKGFPINFAKQMLAPLALKTLREEGKPIPLKYENTACVSGYVRQRLVSKGLIPETAVVIHNGIDLDTFSRSQSVTFSGDTAVRCLVAGRVAAEKGVHTVVEAFVRLQAENKADRFQLIILGDGPAEYVEALHTRVQTNQLTGVIEFAPPVPREQMPAVLSAYDILILPSEYAEPLARAGQEAMGMGLLVIGTITGGSGELLIHEETGLVFTAGDAASLAAQLERVLMEPDRAGHLAASGQRVVLDHFHMERMQDEVEAYLLDLVA